MIDGGEEKAEGNGLNKVMRNRGARQQLRVRTQRASARISRKAAVLQTEQRI
jgi:hypothetical protein